MADIASSTISLLFLLSFLLLPSAILHLIGAPIEVLEDKRYQKKYGEVYENLNRSKSYTRSIFYPLFLLHRYLFIFLVFALPFSGISQASLMIFGTIIFVHYLIKFSPFKDRVDQFLNIFSTLILFVLYGFCLVFALVPVSYQQIREIIGYVFISLIVILFLVNVLTIIIDKIVSCVKERKNRFKRKKDRIKLRELETSYSTNTLTDSHPNNNLWSLSKVPRNWGTVKSTKGNLPAISAVRR